MATKITTSFAIVLTVGMVVTGSVNTLSTKWADNTFSVGRDPDAPRAAFSHPFFQAFGMFVGEFMCLGNAYLRKVGRSSEIERATPDMPFYIFALPAACDMLGTSLMYLGLTYTAASTFQMLRGSVVIFTGIFSVIFLKRKLYPYHWFGMALVLCGLACVGIASILFGSSDSNNAPKPILGDVLVIVAQIVAATQMVVEEKLLDKYKVPALQAVGMEGLFGMGYMLLLLIMFQNIPGLPGSVDTVHFEDSIDALHRLHNNPKILVATLGTLISIPWFNFFGLSVTKHVSATTRMVLDSIRTLVVWAVDLYLGWEQFQYLQIIVFLLLLTGTGVYNKIIYVPNCYLDYRYWAEMDKLADVESKELDSTTVHTINLHAPLLKDGDNNNNNDDGLLLSDSFTIRTQ